jgi:hypothetical protein
MQRHHIEPELLGIQGLCRLIQASPSGCVQRDPEPRGGNVQLSHLTAPVFFER